jgi:hypothetical protein
MSQDTEHVHGVLVYIDLASDGLSGELFVLEADADFPRRCRFDKNWQLRDDWWDFVAETICVFTRGGVIESVRWTPEDHALFAAALRGYFSPAGHGQVGHRPWL